MNFQFEINGDTVNGTVKNFTYNDLFGELTIETQFGETVIDTVSHPWVIDEYLNRVPYSFLRGETKEFEIWLDTSPITKSQIDSIIAYYQAFIEIDNWELPTFSRALIITGTISDDYRKFAGFIKV